VRTLPGIASPSRFSALELHRPNCGSQTSERSRAGIRPGPRQTRPALAACQPSGQATRRCAAAFPAVPCPADQPDFWWPGFRASRLRPALAGKACHRARAARRARAGEGARAETSPCIGTFAAPPGIDRKGRGRRSGRGYLQGTRSTPRASCHAEQATKRGQGKNQSQTQGCQGCTGGQAAQERSQGESRRQGQGSAPAGKRCP